MLLTASMAGMDPRVLAAHNFYKEMILDEIDAKMAAAASATTPRVGICEHSSVGRHRRALRQRHRSVLQRRHRLQIRRNRRARRANAYRGATFGECGWIAMRPNVTTRGGPQTLDPAHMPDAI
jgi:hypothetical protein